MLGDESGAKKKSTVPILGLMQSIHPEKSGRIVVYGDSNCIDASHLESACYWMLDAILEYTSTGHLPSIFKDNQMKETDNFVDTDVPMRMEGNRLYRYSKVLEGNLGDSQPRPLPQCPHLVWAQPNPLNVSAPTNLYQSQKLLALMEDVVVPNNNNNENTIKDASGHHDNNNNNNNDDVHLWSWRNKQVIYNFNTAPDKMEHFNVTVVMLVVLSVLLFIYCVKLYRPKPKKRKLCKKLLNIVQCRRVPSV